MKTGRFFSGAVAAGAILSILALAAPSTSYAQARAVKKSTEPVIGGDGKPISFELRDIEGLGKKGYAKTPAYRSSVSGGRSRGDKDWVTIQTEYRTANEWIDELTFSYHVLTKSQGDKGGNVYSLFRANVTYIDIAEERDHFSTMFLRPNAVERFGDPVAIGVVVTVKGKELDFKSVVEGGMRLPEKWWDDPAVIKNPKVTVTVRDGYLLNRSESPWAFINIDDYETIRR